MAFWNRRKKTNTLEASLAEFLTIRPGPQNAFDLFPNAWSTRFDDVDTRGSFDGFHDNRIEWLLQQVDVSGMKVLELGPLEAAHTTMLENAGADILAIEANKGAFLRCLIAKNHLNLKARFLLGDFDLYDFSKENFDLVLASGVLYHMSEPGELLQRIAGASRRLFIWTHYFEPDLSKWNPRLSKDLADGKWDLQQQEVVKIGNCQIRMVRQNYRKALAWSGFCGGTQTYSKWIYRDDLLGLIKHLGYSTVRIAFDDVGHQNGPSFCVYCERP